MKPYDLDFIPQERSKFKECLLSAYLVNIKLIPTQAAQRISDNEWHYWLEPIDNSKSQFLAQSLANNELTKNFAQMYQTYTDIPPDKAILVETIEFKDNQMLVNWQFKMKLECKV